VELRGKSHRHTNAEVEGKKNLEIDFSLFVCMVPKQPKIFKTPTLHGQDTRHGLKFYKMHTKSHSKVSILKVQMINHLVNNCCHFV
jgi:hypothetical protein